MAAVLHSWLDAKSSATAAFLVLWTAVLLFRLLPAPLTTVPMDVGDPLLNAAILHWNATVTPLTERWWNFPSYFPAPGVTTFTENLLGIWPLASPVIWLTGNPVLAYNVAFALSFPMAGLAMFALVRHLTGSSAGAFAAAVAFAFAPYRASQLSHLQTLWTWGMPLALLGLHQYMGAGRRVGLAWLGLGWLTSALSNGYFIVFFGFYLGCWLLWFGTTPTTRHRLPAVAVTLLIASLPLAPVLLHYVRVHAYYGFTRSIVEIILYSSDLTGIISASPKAPVAARLVRSLHEEGTIFPGLATVALAAWAVVRGLPAGAPSQASRAFGKLALALSALFVIAAIVAWRTDVRLEMSVIRLSLSRPWKPLALALACLVAALPASPRVRAAFVSGNPVFFYAASAVLMWVLCLGPQVRFNKEPLLSPAPYAWLMALPGVTALRVPSRFWMMATLSLAVLVGFAVARLVASGRRAPRVIAAIAVAAMLAEGWMDIGVAQVDLRLARPPAGTTAPVLELPAGSVAEDVAAEFRAVLGGYSTLNGYSGHQPPHMSPLLKGLALRDAEVLREIRRHMEVFVSVRTDDRDGWRSWVMTTHQDAVPVASSGDRTLLRLTKLAAPPRVDRDVPFRILDTSCSSDYAPLAVDGNLSTRWDCGNHARGQRITLDLGQPVTIAGVSPAVGPFEDDAPKHLEIDISESGHEWHRVWRGLTYAASLAGALQDARRHEVPIQFEPVEARYVRLTQIGDQTPFYWSIAELRVLR
jgi:hypothetical protein